MQVDLKLNKQRHPLVVHRLVAIAFVENPNPQEFDQINHIDGDKTNNVAANLEWCNNSLNQIHAYKFGLNVHSDKAGKKKPKTN